LLIIYIYIVVGKQNHFCLRPTFKTHCDFDNIVVSVRIIDTIEPFVLKSHENGEFFLSGLSRKLDEITDFVRKEKKKRREI